MQPADPKESEELAKVCRDVAERSSKILGEFARTEGQKGGEFFTPQSIVRLIVEIIEPFAGRLVTAVREPAPGRKQGRGAQEPVAVPPVARAPGRAACTQDASRGPIDPLLIGLGLQPFAIRRRRRQVRARRCWNGPERRMRSTPFCRA